MDDRERDLIETILRDPGDEAARVRYEEYLDVARPDCVQRRLLRLQREIAHSYADQAVFNRLVDQYVEFRMEHGGFWDWRGQEEFACLFRSFKVWLVSFAESRRFAVKQALRMVLELDETLDLGNLPVVVVPDASPEGARYNMEKVLDFIRRYKGPTGREPEVQPDEIVMKITPSWIDSV